jgi:hypothetical protein
MKKERNLGLFEVLDRSSNIANQFEDIIVRHQECKNNKKLKKASKKIMRKLYAFYQLVGEEYFKDE